MSDESKYRGPIATQGPNDNCKSGCHNYAWHCGRCGGCTGYQGHSIGNKYCRKTPSDAKGWHLCCPGYCELEADGDE